MIKLKEIKPLFSQVLVTEELYGYDDKNAAGIIVAKKGDIKPCQTVIAVGEDVKYVKPGDYVSINFYKYAEFKEDPNSVKSLGGNTVVRLHLKEVELVNENGEDVTCFLIDVRDINYVVKDYEEVVYNDNDDLVKVQKPQVNLILPNTKIKV